MINKYEAIRQEAVKYIKNDNLYVDLYEDMEDYMEQLDIIDEDEREDVLERIDIQGSFYSIERLGMNIDEATIVDTKSITTHYDLLKYIDEEDKYRRKKPKRELLYISRERIDEFKDIYSRYFEGKDFSKCPTPHLDIILMVSVGVKLHGSARLSDHWNFEIEEEVELENGTLEFVTETHCKSDAPDEAVAIGVFDENIKSYISVFIDEAENEVSVVKIKNDGIEIYV
ncbi:hypothetical protein KYI10_12765 (plasmid) [Macrococcus psychrotolerans]|uniref:DUF2313 domain-containing protein n=1 Tax=Macrococcus psychrotolerans TaxID=3039389 RepID=A0AAU7VGL4_9STAP